MNAGIAYSRLRDFYLSTFPPSRYYAKDLSYFHGLEPILDIGCGHGFFRDASPERIIGLDQNPESVRACRDKGLNCIEGSCLSLPFEDQSVNGVYCSHLIEHFHWQEAVRVVEEIDKVLRPGGRLVIKTPLPNPHFYDDPTHTRPYPPSAIIDMFGSRDGQETILGDMGIYTVVSLRPERALLYEPWLPPSCDPRKHWLRLTLRGSAVFLAQFGIRRLRKSAYTLVLEKE